MLPPSKQRRWEVTTLEVVMHIARALGWKAVPSVPAQWAKIKKKCSICFSDTEGVSHVIELDVFGDDGAVYIRCEVGERAFASRQWKVALSTMEFRGDLYHPNSISEIQKYFNKVEAEYATKCNP